MRTAIAPVVELIPREDVVFARIARSLLENDQPADYQARLRSAYPQARVIVEDSDGHVVWWVIRDGDDALASGF